MAAFRRGGDTGRGLDAFLSAMKDQDTRRARELLCDRLKPEFDRTGTFRIGTLGYHPSLTWTIWSEEDAGSWRVCGSEDIFTKAL